MLTSPGRTAALLVALALVVPGSAGAQRIRASQEAWVRQKVANTWVNIHYRRPVARGRELFGGIVAWGRTWTPGADTATSINITAPIQIEGHDLPAGSYSIWMVTDSAGPWTVVLSRATPVFHVPYPGEEQDQLRFQIAPQNGAMMETLTFYFPLVDGTDATLVMHWGTTIIPMRMHAGQ